VTGASGPVSEGERVTGSSAVLTSAPTASSAAAAAPDPAGGPVELAAHDAARVRELCRLALPDEVLELDDLEGVCWPSLQRDDDGALLVRGVDARTVVWQLPDGTDVGAVCVSMTEVAGVRSAHLQLLVVHPAHRGRGIARALVGLAESWALEAGVDILTVGAGAPFYLFTGVDSRWTDALCCFEALGYERVGVELDLRCATQQPATARRPAGDVQVARLADEADVADLMALVDAHHPQWGAEFARAARAGTVVLARDGTTGALLGAAAHSVSRAAVIGPVAVDPDRQAAGVGTLMMQAVLRELSVAGHRHAEIAWTSTVRFYARAVGASVGRTSSVLRRTLSGAASGPAQQR
jgi:GNAT superfamily N-acetyltransferase